MRTILSLMGGGIRGFLQARLLQRLERHVPGFLDRATLLAGTSVGGINALCLAAGRSIEDVLDLYTKHAGRIFASRGLLDSLTPDELVRADFAHDGIYGVLTEVFGDLRMGDLQRDVLIPTFDLREWAPKFYDRVHDADVLVRDVARMTSAAPSYWPTHRWSMDGGLFANDPSDSAIAASIRALRRAGQPVDGQVSCFSVGTGDVPHKPPSAAPDWDPGLIETAKVLLDVLMDGAIQASHFRSQQALNGRYFRLQPKLASVISLSDATKVDELLQVADLTSLDEAVDWLERVWELKRAVRPVA